MAQINDRAVFSLFEDFIKNTRIVEYYPYNHCVDFKQNDIVQCSYMRGFFKVLNVYSSFLVLKCVDNSVGKDFLAYVGPEFVKKVQLNQQVMEVLFNETD